MGHCDLPFWDLILPGEGLVLGAAFPHLHGADLPDDLLSHEGPFEVDEGECRTFRRCGCFFHGRVCLQKREHVLLVDVGTVVAQPLLMVRSHFKCGLCQNEVGGG